MSHEQVPTVVILRLETGKSTIPGVGCMVYGVGCRVVPHSCENKAISAPSWAWAWAWAELGKKFIQAEKVINFGDERTCSVCLLEFKDRNGRKIHEEIVHRQVAQKFKLMKIREQMVNNNLQLVSDPSTPGGVLDNSDNLPVGIDYYYLGS